MHVNEGATSFYCRMIFPLLSKTISIVEDVTRAILSDTIAIDETVDAGHPNYFFQSQVFPPLTKYMTKFELGLVTIAVSQLTPAIPKLNPGS